ncbi:MAG: hypothetical protein PHQ43_00980 [Dehalococcoidales bacterium]|nr:hypothetical protein [Dehalococcoidales bacterium]
MTQGRRPKLTPMVERKRHKEAFDYYLQLGTGRSYRKVADHFNAATTSVSSWAKQFDWDGRIAQHAQLLAEKEKVGELEVTNDPILRKAATMLHQVESMVESAFDYDPATGKYSPKIKIKRASELAEVIRTYKSLLEAYHHFIVDFGPKDDPKPSHTNINNLVMFMDKNLSQEERIAYLKGAGFDATEPTNEHEGDRSAAGGISEADYSEVPERGDED